MERLLPRETLYRPKEGFSIPIKHWLKTDLKDLMLETLAEGRIRDGGLLRYAPIKAMIDAHLADRENYSHQLWALVVFELWRSSFLK